MSRGCSIFLVLLHVAQMVNAKTQNYCVAIQVGYDPGTNDMGYPSFVIEAEDPSVLLESISKSTVCIIVFIRFPKFINIEEKLDKSLKSFEKKEVYIATNVDEMNSIPIQDMVNFKRVFFSDANGKHMIPKFTF